MKFSDDRDWKQFHDSKNLAAAIAIEAAELNELFLSKNGAESEAVDTTKIAEELADIFAFSLLLAENRMGFSNSRRWTWFRYPFKEHKRH